MVMDIPRGGWVLLQKIQWKSRDYILTNQMREHVVVGRATINDKWESH